MRLEKMKKDKRKLEMIAETIENMRKEERERKKNIKKRREEIELERKKKFREKKLKN